MKRSIVDVIDQILSSLKAYDLNLKVVKYQLEDLRSTVLYSAPEISSSNFHWIMLYDILVGNFPIDICQSEPIFNVLKSIMRGYFQHETYSELKNTIKSNSYGYYSPENIQIATEIIEIIEPHVGWIPQLASYKISDNGILLSWIKDKRNSVRMKITSNQLTIKTKYANIMIKTVQSVKLYSQSAGIMTNDMEDFLANIKLLMEWEQTSCTVLNF